MTSTTFNPYGQTAVQFEGKGARKARPPRETLRAKRARLEQERQWEQQRTLNNSRAREIVSSPTATTKDKTRARYMRQTVLLEGKTPEESKRNAQDMFEIGGGEKDKSYLEGGILYKNKLDNIFPGKTSDPLVTYTPSSRYPGYVTQTRLLVAPDTSYGSGRLQLWDHTFGFPIGVDGKPEFHVNKWKQLAKSDVALSAYKSNTPVKPEKDRYSMEWMTMAIAAEARVRVLLEGLLRFKAGVGLFDRRNGTMTIQVGELPEGLQRLPETLTPLFIRKKYESRFTPNSTEEFPNTLPDGLTHGEYEEKYGRSYADTLAEGYRARIQKAEEDAAKIEAQFDKMGYQKQTEPEFKILGNKKPSYYENGHRPIIRKSPSDIAKEAKSVLIVRNFFPDIIPARQRVAENRIIEKIKPKMSYPRQVVARFRENLREQHPHLTMAEKDRRDLYTKLHFDLRKNTIAAARERRGIIASARSMYDKHASHLK